MFNNWSDLLPTVKKAFGALGKSNPKMVKAYMALGEAAEENNVLDAKTRELISIGNQGRRHPRGSRRHPGYRDFAECRRRVHLLAARPGSLRHAQTGAAKLSRNCCGVTPSRRLNTLRMCWASRKPH
jgi:hypothetical protein